MVGPQRRPASVTRPISDGTSKSLSLSSKGSGFYGA